VTEVDVLVLGAGVIGLTTAVHLAEAGMRVELRTAAPPESTTSAAAGAMWGPYLVEPRDRVLRWAQQTLDDLTRLAHEEPASGVRLASGLEASRREATLPEWAGLLPDVTPCRPDELPPGFASGYRYTAPLVDMPVYLTYLCNRLHAAGGTLRVQPVSSLDEAAARAPAVVNCTGIAARDLAADPDLYPIRGQLVVLANPGITEFFTEDTGDSPDLLCIYPHGDTVVLGGTAEPHRWHLEPDPQTAAAIVARCAAITPNLASAPILAHRVGLRPTRPTIRVDEQPHPNGTRIIHNYGHGGAGVSLSWGCARDTAVWLTTPPEPSDRSLDGGSAGSRWR